MWKLHKSKRVDISVDACGEPTAEVLKSKDLLKEKQKPGVYIYLDCVSLQL